MGSLAGAAGMQVGVGLLRANMETLEGPGK